MRKIYSFIIILILTLITSNLYSQCDTFEFLDDCTGQIKPFTFIKSFDVNFATKKGSSKKMEFSYPLNSGHTYIFATCGGNEAKMILNLFDRNHKLIATNYIASSKKYYETLVYECNSTSEYFFEVSFENDQKTCGVVVLGFKAR
ncbi:MAG: hypothetical protein Q8880_03775 [Bacteroidota bacterium]|nr:hypothetical protein [Bacteroidota bacterium]